MSSHELSDTVERVLQLCDTYFEDTPQGPVRVPAVAGAHDRQRQRNSFTDSPKVATV